MRRYAFEGGIAVVTGAASGIGAALAAGLAARGSNLVLLDRDADGLAAVAAAARAMPTGVRVAEHVADLADPAAAVAAGEAIAAAHPETTLLINNAGVALAGRFDQVDAAQFDAVIAVNLQAVVTMTRALLPVLTAHPGAGSSPRRARRRTAPASSPSAGSSSRCAASWRRWGSG
jgi:short-subunit dehydrogenase